MLNIIKKMLISGLFSLLVFQWAVACNQNKGTDRKKPVGAQYNNNVQPYPYNQYNPYGNPITYDQYGNPITTPLPNTYSNTGSLPSSCTTDPNTKQNIDPNILAIEKAIWQLTNSYRGSSPFEFSERIACVARDWSRQQANSGDIGHSGFPRQRESLYYQLFPGWKVDMSAENVAYIHGQISRSTGTFNAQAIAEELTETWWNSWGHRRNMQGDYRYLEVWQPFLWNPAFWFREAVESEKTMPLS